MKMIKYYVREKRSGEEVLVAESSTKIGLTLKNLGYDPERFDLIFGKPKLKVEELETRFQQASRILGASVYSKSPMCLFRTAIGDLLMMFMAVDAFSQQYPEVPVILTTHEPYLDLCRRQKFFSDVILDTEVNQIEFPVFLNMEGTVDFVNPTEQKPRQEMFAELFKVSLPAKTANYIHLTKEEKKWANDFLSEYPRPIIGMMPVSKSYLRDWRREKELVLRNPDKTFLVFHHQELPQWNNISNVVNLTAKTTIMEMCALMNACDLGGFTDTGLMHICGNLDVPYISIFGGVIPPEYRIKYYTSVIPVDNSACPFTFCFDGMLFNCLNSGIWKRCMSEKSIPLDEIQDLLEKIVESSSLRGELPTDEIEMNE